MYTPKTTSDYEASVRREAWVAMAKARVMPTDAAVHLIVEAVLPVPVSWPKDRRMAAMLGGIRPKSKPDLSNIIKAIEDGCNGVVYRDDSQICSMTAVKRYTSEDRPVGAYVTFSWSEPQV